MIRNDSVDVQSLIAYINDTKPYHTKLAEVSVDYQYHDSASVDVTDDHTISINMSSVWKVLKISNGVSRRFRIPAIQIPRHNKGHGHLKYTVGVDDYELGAFRIPFNNGSWEVKHNGTPLVYGTDYKISNDYNRGTLRITNPEILTNGDVLHVDLMVMDSMFIKIDGIQREYTIVGFDYDTGIYSTSEREMLEGAWAVSPLDSKPFDVDGNLIDTREVGFNNQDGSPLGKILEYVDETGGIYNIFELDEPLPEGMEIEMLIYQQGNYGEIAKVGCLDSLKMYDNFRFNESVQVIVEEPIRYSFDDYPFDTRPFDGANVEMGLTTIVKIEENNPNDSDSIASTSVTDSVIFDIREV